MENKKEIEHAHRTMQNIDISNETPHGTPTSSAARDLRSRIQSDTNEELLQLVDETIIETNKKEIKHEACSLQNTGMSDRAACGIQMLSMSPFFNIMNALSDIDEELLQLVDNIIIENNEEEVERTLQNIKMSYITDTPMLLMLLFSAPDLSMQLNLSEKIIQQLKDEIIKKKQLKNQIIKMSNKSKMKHAHRPMQNIGKSNKTPHDTPTTSSTRDKMSQIQPDTNKKLRLVDEACTLQNTGMSDKIPEDKPMSSMSSSDLTSFQSDIDKELLQLAEKTITEYDDKKKECMMKNAEIFDRTAYSSPMSSISPDLISLQSDFEEELLQLMDKIMKIDEKKIDEKKKKT